MKRTSDDTEKKMAIGKIFYWILILVAFVIVAFFVYINSQEIIDRSNGITTTFSQMTWLNDEQAIYYSAAYLVPFVALTYLLILFVAKKRNKSAVIVSFLILFIGAIELLTDHLARFNV